MPKRLCVATGAWDTGVWHLAMAVPAFILSAVLSVVWEPIVAERWGIHLNPGCVGVFFFVFWAGVCGAAIPVAWAGFRGHCISSNLKNERWHRGLAITTSTLAFVFVTPVAVGTFLYFFLTT